MKERDPKEKNGLSKLRRKDLLEILLRQTELAERYEKSYRRSAVELKLVQEKNEFLEAENQSLKNQLREAERKLARVSEELEERRIFIEESGSIAEAAVKINALFEVAQKTVDDYINNARKRYEEETARPTM